MSVKEKSRLRIVAGEDQGDERKRTIRNIRDGVETGVLSWFQDKHGRTLFTARAAPGIKVAGP